MSAARHARMLIAAAVLYGSGAVVTFGHAAAHADPPKCTKLRSGAEWCGIDDRIGVGVGAAFFWPLYWSWEAWS